MILQVEVVIFWLSETNKMKQIITKLIFIYAAQKSTSFLSVRTLFKE